MFGYVKGIFVFLCFFFRTTAGAAEIGVVEENGPEGKPPSAGSASKSEGEEVLPPEGDERRSRGQREDQIPIGNREALEDKGDSPESQKQDAEIEGGESLPGAPVHETPLDKVKHQDDDQGIVEESVEERNNGTHCASTCNGVFKRQ